MPAGTSGVGPMAILKVDRFDVVNRRFGWTMTDYLFVEGSLSDRLRAIRSEINTYVATIDPEDILSTPEADLVNQVLGVFVAQSPTLHRERALSPFGAQDVEIDVTHDRSRAVISAGTTVPGTRFELHIPFSGDGQLFRFQPSSCSASPPVGRVVNDHLVVRAEVASDRLDPERFKDELERNIGEIERWLAWVKKDCDAHNSEIPSSVRSAIQNRKQKVLADRNLESFIGVPVVHRRDPLPTFAVSLPKKTVKIPKPINAKKAPFAPEPAIAPQDYLDILKVISSFGSLIERVPDTFRPMGEEVLREVLLVVLNNQFGTPVGELFSRKGKTDVAIIHEDGVVFIAECKIWAGSKAFRQSIDQLLGYLVWRDTKAALVVFLREKDVTTIAARALQELKGHSRFKRMEDDLSNVPICVLHHEGDVDREIRVALILVPIP